MGKIVKVYENGGPDKLIFEENSEPLPNDDEVVIKQSYSGLNLIDTYQRSGLYPLPLPSILGSEGAGTVYSVGKNVKDLKPGDSVTYILSIGSYSEYKVIAANKVVKLPKGISEKQAAGMMLKGSTVQYLMKQTYKILPGDIVLIHAAAGGVGLIACQWAKHLGATVIGTVGSDEKAAIAKQNGCDYPIVYSKEDFVPIVMDITKGKKLPVVYDSVGKETLTKSMDCLQPRGLLVSYGNASGAPPMIDVLTLMQKGSIFLTRPNLAHYILDRESILKISEDLFSVVINNSVKISIDQLYNIEKVNKAHEDIENRITTGSSVLKF